MHALLRLTFMSEHTMITWSTHFRNMELPAFFLGNSKQRHLSLSPRNKWLTVGAYLAREMVAPFVTVVSYSQYICALYPRHVVKRQYPSKNAKRLRYLVHGTVGCKPFYFGSAKKTNYCTTCATQNSRPPTTDTSESKVSTNHPRMVDDALEYTLLLIAKPSTPRRT